MDSPSLALQGSIVNRLKQNAAVQALVGGRVYDSPPLTAAFPYITVGEGDETSEDADCVDGYEVSLDIDVWSREVGYVEAKRISQAVRTALKSPELTIPVHALVYFRHRQTRTFRDPDGKTSHAVLTYESFVEEE